MSPHKFTDVNDQGRNKREGLCRERKMLCSDIFEASRTGRSSSKDKLLATGVEKRKI